MNVLGKYSFSQRWIHRTRAAAQELLISSPRTALWTGHIPARKQTEGKNVSVGTYMQDEN